MFRSDYGNRLAWNTVPTAPCKSLGRPGRKGTALITGVPVTSRRLFLLPIQHSWFVNQLRAPCSSLSNEPIAQSFLLATEGKRHRPHWLPAGSLVTSLFPPLQGFSQSFHAGFVKAITFLESSYISEDKRACARPLWPGRGGGFLWARASAFHLYLLTERAAVLDTELVSLVKNVATALTLCWMVK